MSMSDPLADMLTRIRNGIMANLNSVDMPRSNTKVNVAKVLKDEGFIAGYSLSDDGPQGTLAVELKYGPNGESVITGIKRVSKPGLRIYAKSNAIPEVLSGLGVSIISTSNGIITNKLAKANNVGGEILCEVW